MTESEDNEEIFARVQLLKVRLDDSREYIKAFKLIYKKTKYLKIMQKILRIKQIINLSHFSNLKSFQQLHLMRSHFLLLLNSY